MTLIHALISAPLLLAPQDCDDDGGGGSDVTPATDITFRWEIGAPIPPPRGAGRPPT
jgi:hypothetical protein